MKVPVIKQKGIGIIEVLITLLILSTSLMALAALQTRSLQYNQESYFRSQANIMATDVLERLRVHTINNAVWAGAGPLPNLSQFAQADIANWQAGVTSLPGGAGNVVCIINTRVCTVTITWDELSRATEQADGNAQMNFTYTARL